MNDTSTPSPQYEYHHLGPGRFLSGIKMIWARECGAIFDSSIAYIYLIVFVLSATGMFMNDFFLRAVVDMTPFFQLLPFLIMIFLPALTMRTWAEEKRVQTFELIMTLPLLSSQVILGKYCAVLTFYLLTLCCTLPIVVMLIALGQPDLGLIFSSYLGAGFLGAAFIAIGLFASGLTANQIVAFVIAGFLDFLFVITGQEKLVSVLDGVAPNLQMGTFLFESFSIMPHYETLTRGSIEMSQLVYFFAVITLFLWMNTVIIARSRD